MNPTKHIILGLLFSFTILIIFPKIKIIGFFVIFLSSFLIDADHYIYYFYNKKKFNLLNAYKEFIKKKKEIKKIPKEKRKEYYGGIFIFHGIEIVILLLLLSYFSLYFLYIAIGFSFHLFLDIIYGIYFIKRFDRFSLIWDIYKRKKLKILNYQKL